MNLVATEVAHVSDRADVELEFQFSHVCVGTRQYVHVGPIGPRWLRKNKDSILSLSCH